MTRYPIYRKALLRIAAGVLSLPVAISIAWVCEEAWGCGQIALIAAIAAAVIANMLISLCFFRYRRCPKCGARALSIFAEGHALAVAPYWATCRRCSAQMPTDAGVSSLNGLPVRLRPDEGE